MKTKTLAGRVFHPLVAAGILLTAGSVFSQGEKKEITPIRPAVAGERKAVAVDGPVPAELRTALSNSDRQLTSIEQMFTRLEAVKMIGNNYGDDLNEPLAAYAKGMSESFDAAMKQADLAAKSQGKEGSIQAVKVFEDLAIKHESRMKQLDNKSKNIVLQVKEGTVQIDKSILQQAAPGERAEFLQSLNPNGRKEMGQKHPELFKGLPDAKNPTSWVQPQDKLALRWPMLEKITNVLISPAQAAIALTVYNACHNSDNSTLTAAQWATCLQVTQTAISLKAQAQSTYNSCASNAHGGGGGHWKHLHWKATMLITCGAALVIRLA